MILDMPYSWNAIFLTTLFLYIYCLFFSLILPLFVGYAVFDNVGMICICSFASRKAESIGAIALVFRLVAVGHSGQGGIGDGRFSLLVFGADVGFWYIWVFIRGWLGLGMLLVDLLIHWFNGLVICWWLVVPDLQ